MVGQQLRDSSDVALVDQTAASGARMSLALGVLVAEIVTAPGRIGLEPIRRLAETLGRRPVGFQLGHETYLQFYSKGSQGGSRHPLTRGTASRRLRAPPTAHFFFGENTMTICRPSIIGNCSTIAAAA